MRVVAAVVVVEVEVVVEVGMKILDMGMTYSCWALLLSRPYPAVRVFFLHQHHRWTQISFSRTLDAGGAVGCGKGLSINYVIADRGGGVSPKDYSITS